MTIDIHGAIAHDALIATIFNIAFVIVDIVVIVTSYFPIDITSPRVRQHIAVKYSLRILCEGHTSSMWYIGYI